MRTQIEDMCNSCSECAKFGKTATKEPMKSLPIPTLPWQIVSQDLFEFEDKDYLVTVCHFSDWIELDELKRADATTVIECTKAHFARFGIPQICHTDNGSQFISDDYHKKFVSLYGFKHTRSSPYHPKGNGRAEAAVKVCKNMLKKSSDIEAALLNYRNTPQQGHSYSPAQRMMNHRTRTLLPTSNILLRSKAVDTERVTTEIVQKRVDAKRNYDRTAGVELQPLNVGSYAYVKPPPSRRGREWSYGQVTETNGNRSYTIKTPFSTVRRNRSQITPAAAPAAPIRPVLVRTILPQIEKPKQSERVPINTDNKVPSASPIKSRVITSVSHNTSSSPMSNTVVSHATPAPNIETVAANKVHQSGRPARGAGLPKRYDGYVM